MKLSIYKHSDDGYVVRLCLDNEELEWLGSAFKHDEPYLMVRGDIASGLEVWIAASGLRLKRETKDETAALIPVRSVGAVGRSVMVIPVHYKRVIKGDERKYWLEPLSILSDNFAKGKAPLRTGKPYIPRKQPTPPTPPTPDEKVAGVAPIPRPTMTTPKPQETGLDTEKDQPRMEAFDAPARRQEIPGAGLETSVSTKNPDGQGYDRLAEIFSQALADATSGKGRARHAQDKPWMEQRMIRIGLETGPAGPVFQACKKSQESLGLPWDAGRRELLGALNYIAGAIIVGDELNARKK